MKRSLLDITQKISRKLGDPELTPKDLNHPTYWIYEAKGWRFVEILREIDMLNRFNSNAKKLNRIIPKINPNNLNDDLYITGSLLNIEAPTTNKFNSNTKSNPNPTKLVNNKNKIESFHNEILQFSGRTVSRIIDTFDNTGFGTLTIYNVLLDYGTEGASSENFEILVYGLHLPGHYIVKQVGNNVVITLLDNYIDYDSVTINDIYVIGKLIDIPIASEDGYNIITEDGLDIII